MREFATFLAGAILALCVALPGTAAAAQSKICTLQEVASLHISMSPGHPPTIPVRIDGKLYHFNYDPSDEPRTAVGAGLVKALDLPSSRLFPSGGVEIFADVKIFANGKKIDRQVTLPDLEIGNASIKDVKVMDASNVLKAGGVIGLDALAQMDDELDLNADKLNLFRPARCGAHVVYWHADRVAAIPIRRDAFGHIFFDGRLDGHPVTIAFSLAPPSAWIFTNDLQDVLGIETDDPKLTKLPLYPRDHPPKNMPGKFQCVGMQCYRYPFSELSLGGIVIKNPDITIVEQPPNKQCVPRFRQRAPAGTLLKKTLPACFGNAQLTLGRAELRQLHLYFAFKQKILYVTPADASAAATPPAPSASQTKAASSAAPASNARN